MKPSSPSKVERLTVATVQMTSVPDVVKNLKQIEYTLAKLKRESVDLVCFPEVCHQIRESKQELFVFEEEDVWFTRLSELALEGKFAIHLGSVALKQGDQTFNSSVWVTDEGKISFPYQKIHLFDLDIPGQITLMESDVFSPGSTPSTTEVKGWHLGLSICYDLRFSELYSRYAEKEVDLVMIPSAFTVPTGAAHWDILVRARAIESQCFVVAAAQCGKHHATRASYGHSLVVDPWGEVIWRASQDQPAVGIFSLDSSKIAEVRKRLPMARHRRLNFRN